MAFMIVSLDFVSQTTLIGDVYLRRDFSQPDSIVIRKRNEHSERGTRCAINTVREESVV
jgi:hypothetical protein